MSKLLTTTVLVALATLAAAFSNSQSTSTTVYINPHGVDLTCHPMLDRSDRDPVVRTHINLSFVPDTDLHISTFDVRHERLSGQIVDRTQQYTPPSDGLYKSPGKADWEWRGQLDRNHAIWMKAHVWKNAVGWHYQEVVYKNRVEETVIPAETRDEEMAGE